MDLNLYMMKGFPLNPTLSWEYIMGPGEDNFNLKITNNITGHNNNNPVTAKEISISLFIGCCHSGIKPVFNSIMDAPKTLLVFTEPDRMSRVSAGILTSTFFSLSWDITFSSNGFSFSSNARITWLI